MYVYKSDSGAELRLYSSWDSFQGFHKARTSQKVYVCFPLPRQLPWPDSCIDTKVNSKFQTPESPNGPRFKAPTLDFFCMRHLVFQVHGRSLTGCGRVRETKCRTMPTPHEPGLIQEPLNHQLALHDLAWRCY